MRLFWFLLLAGIVAAAQNSGKPAPKGPVSREELALIEQRVDGTIRALDVNDPYDLLGFTRGVYLPGYGVVFSTEVNLVITPITPFHQIPEGKRLVDLHDKKVKRLTIVRDMMKQVLVFSAAALDNVPPDQQVAFGLTLFYRSFEMRENLPGQIVMRAPRGVLTDFGAKRISEAALQNAISIQEY